MKKNRNMVYIATVGLALLAMVGCSSKNVKPTYVSPTKYQTLNCEQLDAEYERINEYLAHGISTQKSNGSGVGIGIGAWGGSGGYWGVAPSISVDLGRVFGRKRNEMAELYGQQDAIAQAASFKNCTITHPRVSQTNKAKDEAKK